MKHTVELSPELQELAEKTERDIVRLSEHLLEVTDRLEQLGSAFQKTADEAVRARLYSKGDGDEAHSRTFPRTTRVS